MFASDLGKEIVHALLKIVHTTNLRRQNMQLLKQGEACFFLEGKKKKVKYKLSLTGFLKSSSKGLVVNGIVLLK